MIRTSKKSRAELLNYISNFEKNIFDKPDEDYFKIKRESLKTIIRLTYWLLFDFRDLYCESKDFENKIKRIEVKNRTNEIMLDDYSYKNYVLRDYFYRCNKAIKLLKKYNDNEINMYAPVDKCIAILKGEE